ncbi:Tyr recombinase domain-containing protein [Cupriavidus necator]
MPLFDPTVYVLNRMRGTNRAANTIELTLRHIMLFKLFIEQEGIDLEARFRDGRILDLHEIESLAKVCSQRLPDFLASASEAESKRQRVGATVRLLKFPSNVVPRAVESTSAANRIRAIEDYLGWLVKKHLLRLPTDSSSFLVLEAAQKIVKDTLLARAPEDRGRNTLGAREGLAPATADRVLQVTARNSSENPWKGQFTKVRNELLFRWLSSFGLRRGEILNIKVSDIDFRKETVTVARRPDAAEDPRKEQPLVKTRDRVLPIPPELCRLTHDYVVHSRRGLVGARKHEYLFVADKTGAPLSLSALNKCFAFLRQRIPDLPDDLVPHVLRHTWNDKFSDAMDRTKTPEPDEQKMRSFLMGWSETSGTASTYTRRHVRQKANEVSLQLQAAKVQTDEI